MRMLPAFCLSCCIFAAHSAHANRDRLYTVRTTEVKAKPFSDADTLSSSGVRVRSRCSNASRAGCRSKPAAQKAG